MPQPLEAAEYLVLFLDELIFELNQYDLFELRDFIALVFDIAYESLSLSSDEEQNGMICWVCCCCCLL